MRFEVERFRRSALVPPIDQRSTAPQHRLLRAPLSAALEAFSSSGPIRLRVADVGYAPLGEISGPDVCGGGERIAGVLAHCGTRPRRPDSGPHDADAFLMAPCRMGLLAMESEDAFAVFQQFASGEEILETYKAWGSGVVSEASRGLARIASQVHPGPASLEENSVISILVGTHAPSDTVVVTLRLELISSAGETSTPAFVYLLVDPKLFGATLADMAQMTA